MRDSIIKMAQSSAAMAIACCIVGCSSDSELPNRVSVDIAVMVGGKTVSEGTLVLRPQPGVKCPLIKMAVVNGVGHLPQSEGPVPGDYRATFRPGQAQENLTEQLSQTGRVAPGSAGSVSSTSSTVAQESELTPKGDAELTVPNENPALVAVSFDPA